MCLNGTRFQSDYVSVHSACCEVSRPIWTRCRPGDVTDLTLF